MSSFTSQGDPRKIGDGLVQRLMEATSDFTGVQFFEILARELAGLLGYRGAMVAEWVEDDSRNLRCLASWDGNKLHVGGEFRPAGDQSEEELAKDAFCWFAENRGEISNGEWPAASAILAVTMATFSGKTGRPIGLLGLFHDEALTRRPSCGKYCGSLAGGRRRTGAAARREGASDGRTPVRASWPKRPPLAFFNWIRRGIVFMPMRRTSQMCGVPPLEMRGREWARYLHPGDRGLFKDQYYAALRAIQPFQAEYRFVHPSGQVVWVLGQGAPLHDAGGRHIGFVGTLTDLTDRKHIEDELREKETRLRIMIQHMPAIIWTTDRELRVTASLGKGLRWVDLFRTS